MTDGDLPARLRQLAACRRALGEARAQYDAALAEWQAANAALIMQVRICMADVGRSDAEVRALALDLYRQMGAPALDRKAFDRIADSIRPSFVTWRQEPQVTIATDLDKALSGGAS